MVNFKEVMENRFHIYPGYSKVIAPHGHDFIEFAYIARGTIEHKYNNGESEIATEGDYYIVDYNSVHSYKQISKERATVINFLFYPDFIDRVLTGYKTFDDILNTYSLKFSYKNLKSSPTGKIFHDRNRKIGNIVDDIVKEYEDKNYGYFEYIRCKLIEILILTLREVGKSEPKPEYSDIVNEMIAYAKKNYNEKIKLGEIADKYNYSISSISKKFKEEKGEGFSKYIQRIRIEKSCHLLATTDLTIRDIALTVGYDDVKFFRDTFKESLKISPREFRNLNR
ncbi:MAG: helix-turn-helix domain-containing protein [Clostridia bacterium]|nr:helix-turn-helix domain-containing protein [Clostridia bacterium]